MSLFEYKSVIPLLIVSVYELLISKSFCGVIVNNLFVYSISIWIIFEFELFTKIIFALFTFWTSSVNNILNLVLVEILSIDCGLINSREGAIESFLQM